MAKIERLLQFMEESFGVSEFPDYPHALNGLQVAGPVEVERLAVAVDASEVAIGAALEWGAQLLLVHHGLFWDGFGPLTGRRFRKVAALVRGEMALYALHLPLDAHGEMGNCAELTRRMGLVPQGPFGDFKGKAVGSWAEAGMSRDALKERLGEAVGGEVRVIPGGPPVVEKVGVLTGAGASALPEAAAMGLHALVTGEAAHHNFHDAMELGVNLYLAGHYATETFGVRALGHRLEEEFGLAWRFLDFPTGL